MRSGKESLKSNDSSKNSSDYVSDSDDDMTFSDTEEFDFTGLILKHRYGIIKKLGSGSYATVWLCYDIQKDKFYAIKIQNPEDYDYGEDEVDILKVIRNKSPRLITLIDNFIYESDDGEHVCMILELLAGSLYDIAKNYTLSFSNIVNILRQLLEGMHILNKQCKTLHTDIKPENILLMGNNKGVIKIMQEWEKFDFKGKCKNKKRRRGRKGPNPKQLLGQMISILDRKKLLDDTKDQNQFDDEHLIDFDIVLSDMGTCCEIKKNMSFQIQTRYYRAPEIILHYPFNETCDVWSVGCLAYELFTKKLLFDPDKKSRFNRDRHHLLAMQQKLGRIPEHMIIKSKRGNIFFRKNGTIKGMSKGTYQTNVEYKSIFDDLNEKKRMCSNDKLLIVDFIERCLIYDPKKRPKPGQLLNHKLFNC